MTIDCGSGGTTEPASALLLARCASLEKRRRLVASDYVAEFTSLGSTRFRSRLAGFHALGVRGADVHDVGGIGMRAARSVDALGGVFLLGSSVRIDGVAYAAPRFVVACPGTEVVAMQQGRTRNLRVAFAGPRSRPSPTIRRPAARCGHGSRPASSDRWPRPQESGASSRRSAIVHASRSAPGPRGIEVGRVLDVAAEAVSALLVDVLRDADDGHDSAQPGTGIRRRLVRRAVDILDANPDVPVSVAGVCRQLQVSERTLRRAFQDNLGIGLRAYERAHRLRGVHGAILLEGDRRSVTDVAMSFGSWHLGRFAAAYKAMFGCSLSETRRRVWDESV